MTQRFRKHANALKMTRLLDLTKGVCGVKGACACYYMQSITGQHLGVEGANVSRCLYDNVYIVAGRKSQVLG